MLFPFRLLVLHSSVWFFSFSSSVSCWSLILSLYQIPIGMLCSFFFPLSFNAIIKNCYCEMNFHMDVVLPWNVHFILYIWFNSSNMTSETKTTAHERDLKWMEKKNVANDVDLVCCLFWIPLQKYLSFSSFMGAGWVFGILVTGEHT